MLARIQQQNVVIIPRAGNVIPLSGEMGEAQKVIPFLREMSRSDKRFADVLRLPTC